MPPRKIGSQRLDFSTAHSSYGQIEIDRVGCDLAFLLIGHRVNFGLRRFGINEAVNTQTAL